MPDVSVPCCEQKSVGSLVNQKLGLNCLSDAPGSFYATTLTPSRECRFDHRSGCVGLTPDNDHDD